MEARAKFEFNAGAEDELSFCKGDILKILGYQDDWLKAEMRGQEGFIPKNYVEHQTPSWYQQNTTRVAAEEKLIPSRVGEFLIRNSQSSPGDFSISVRHENDVQHFKVMRDKQGQYYLWNEKFTSLNKLVEFYKTSSISKQTNIFLRDENREEPRSNYPRPQPTERNNRRATESGPSQQSKCLELRTHNTVPAGKNSPNNTFPSPRRSSDITPPPRPALQVRAVYDFTAEEDDELGFTVGDIIEVLDHSDASWWRGRLGLNIGLFPANYTTQI